MKKYTEKDIRKHYYEENQKFHSYNCSNNKLDDNYKENYHYTREYIQYLESELLKILNN